MTDYGELVIKELDKYRSKTGVESKTTKKYKDIIYKLANDPRLCIEEDFKVSLNTFRKFLNTNYKLPDKPHGRGWVAHLLFLVGFKTCYSCKIVKDIELGYYPGQKACIDCQASYREANRDKQRAYTKQHYIDNKEVYKARAVKRRCIVKSQTPIWADKEAIQKMYDNRPKGHHVDHIVPLKGDEVCGLHVEYNLQYLTAEENLKKSNKLLEEVSNG